MKECNVYMESLVNVIRSFKHDESKFDFFRAALEAEEIEICRACLYSGIDTNIMKDERTLLMDSIRRNKLTVKMAEWLIKHRVNINYVSCDGWSALTYSCATGNIDMVRCLIEKGAFISEKDIEIATTNRYFELCEMLKKDN